MSFTKKIIYDGTFKQHCGKNKYYDFEKMPHILPKVERIVTFGDIHGDFELAVDLLITAKVIDNDHNWIGGKTVVVQVGDQVDRCRPKRKGDCKDKNYLGDNDENSDIKILEFFHNLNKKAKAKGGMVICLLGNHEINNVFGSMSYVSYKGIVGFKDEINPKTGNTIAQDKGFVGTDYEIGLQVRKYLFERGRKYAQFLGCARQSIVIIGSYLFVHASVVEELAENFPNYNGIKKINVLIREWLLNLRRSKDVIPGTNLNMRDLLLNSEVSPLLPRNLGYLDANLNMTDEKCMTELYNVYKSYNIYGMIIGHTPQLNEEDGITLTCTGELKGKKIFVARVDSGSSHAFDIFASKPRGPRILEILNNGEKVNFISKTGSKDAFEDNVEDLNKNEKIKNMYK